MTEPPHKTTAAPAGYPHEPWRRRLYVIIFEADTPSGRLFDVVLIAAILLSVVAVMLESIAWIRVEFGTFLRVVEWTFTLIFSVEYLLRLVSAYSAPRYARSFFGLVDLLAVVPTYLALFVPGAQYFLVIRMLRVLRVFRVLKLAQYMDQANLLMVALKNSRRKIEVFLLTVFTIVVILGSLMYFLEGEENGFSSIPISVYWAIVTLTTVGYGDISPQTPLGQVLAALIMIMGYGIIAVPTGIVTTELVRADRERPDLSLGPRRQCPACNASDHSADAAFCRHCGAALDV